MHSCTGTVCEGGVGVWAWVLYRKQAIVSRVPPWYMQNQHEASECIRDLGRSRCTISVHCNENMLYVRL